MLQKVRVLEQTQDLAEEGDRLLVELLRIADVGTYNLLEGQGLVALSNPGAVLLGLDSKLAADGVLGLDDVRVDVSESKSRHGASVVEMASSSSGCA